MICFISLNMQIMVMSYEISSAIFNNDIWFAKTYFWSLLKAINSNFIVITWPVGCQLLEKNVKLQYHKGIPYLVLYKSADNLSSEPILLTEINKWSTEITEWMNKSIHTKWWNVTTHLCLNFNTNLAKQSLKSENWGVITSQRKL